MPNLTITNNDLGGVVLKGGQFRDELITFAGADTFVAGTILARDSGTLKLVKFVKGGVTAGNGIPKAILTYDVVATAAGDVPSRVAVSGEFVKSRLVIDLDGNDTNVDAAVIDQLREYGLTPVTVTDLSKLDNQ